MSRRESVSSSIWSELISKVLIPILIPALAELIAALIKNLSNQTGGLESQAVGAIEDIVNGIESGHPDWDSKTKLEFAQDAFDAYAKEHRMFISTSMRNALIELAVQKQKATQVEVIPHV